MSVFVKILFGVLPVWAQLSSGSFWNSSCKNTPFGVMRSGTSRVAYSTPLPAGPCTGVQETRTCNKNTLSGSFTNTTCVDGCVAGSTSNCDYTADASGASSGVCASGFSGACSFSCTGGLRAQVSNTCSSGGQWTAISTTGAPAGRRNHVTIYTGTKIIVWGGETSSGPTVRVNTGGVYDIATSTWTATSMSGVPATRTEHGAVWTGSKMFVWGGTTASSSYTNTGGLYNPATDAWSTVSTTGAPSARRLPYVAWTGSKIVVWGGSTGTGAFTNTGGVYDPATNTWTTMATPSLAGRIIGAYAASSTKFFVWGGNGAANAYYGDGAVYDMASNTWTTMTTTGALALRVYTAGVWTGSKFAVFGGTLGAGSGCTGCTPNDGALYDPTNNTWTSMTTTGAPVGRNMASMVWNGSKIFVWGGSGTGVDSTGGLYDPATNTWTTSTATNAPAPAYYSTGQTDSNRFVIWGGATFTNLGGIYQY